MALIRPRILVTPAGMVGTSSGGGGGSVLFDAYSTGGNAGAGAPATWTHTPVGTPTAVVVLFSLYTAGNSVAGLNVTYGGVTMTQSAHSPQISQSTVNTYAFYLTNPLAGARTVSINGWTGTQYVQGFAVTVTGSNTTNSFDVDNGNIGNGTSPSTTVASAVGRLVIDIGTYDNPTTPAVPGGSQTQVGSILANGGTRAVASYKSGAASVPMSWSISPTSTTWAEIALSLKP